MACGIQHLVVVFYSACDDLYLKTDILSCGLKYRRFILTLAVNLFASICRPSILILPAIILSHIILSAKQTDRLKKYDIWRPLFLCIFYPLFIFAIGDLVFMFSPGLIFLFCLNFNYVQPGVIFLIV